MACVGGWVGIGRNVGVYWWVKVRVYVGVHVSVKVSQIGERESTGCAQFVWPVGIERGYQDAF